MSTKQKRFILPEDEIPTQWYNIQADMPNKPLPPLNPATKQPMKAEDMYPIFAKACCDQEMDTEHAWIDIPEEVRDMYKYYRSTPLVRAYGLEKALGTPAHIYFKNESVSPVGSHKLNSALAQAYYCKQEGITNVTTETGAGQWGAALSYAAKVFGLEAAVYQVKISYNQKPYRRSIMQAYGAQVTPSPSMSTRAGKDVLTKDPNNQGSLGTAISEAVELAMTTPNCKYVLGSVLNHVALHQTVIGLEAEKQMAMAGEYPDIVIACFGGGSNFGGCAFPFMRHNILDGKKTRFIAAEPSSCPKLTHGVFQYDFGDLLLLPDDLRCDAGGEGAVHLQVKGAFAHDGAMAEAKVPLVILADPENDAVGVGEHHVVRQDQVIFRADDVKQALEIDVILKEVQKICRL